MIFILAFAKNFHRPVMTINICNLIFNIGPLVSDLWLDGAPADAKRSIDQRGLEPDRVKLLPLRAPKKRC